MTAAHPQLLAGIVLAGPLLLLSARPVAQEGQPAPAPPPRAVPAADGLTALADLMEFQERLERLLERARPAIVGIRVPGQSGSGVLVSPDGLILTAAHVVTAPGIDCTVQLADGRELRARSLGANHLRDSGMLRITEALEDLPFVAIPPPRMLVAGEWCVVLGHPGGFEVGRGPVPRLGRIQDAGGQFVRTDAPLIGGDSGGPLFDLNGDLIGIHSRIQSDVAINFHVPMSAFRLGRKRLLAGDEWWRSSAKLGALRVSNARAGARLDVLRSGRPAALAGLAQGDVVTHLNGERVRDKNQLKWYLGDLSPGDEVAFTILRGGSAQEFAVTLAGAAARQPIAADGARDAP